MPFSHILDLNERRSAYADQLQALYNGAQPPVARLSVEDWEQDLKAKIAALDLVIAGRAAGSASDPSK